MRASLSVAIITLNEERNLPACLESVRWAEELVVCDSGSHDRTLEIAHAYGARTYRDLWRGFAGHKNLAVERCGMPWVLVMDADERVTPELRAEIERILADPAAADGYWVPRRNYFLGRWIRGGGWHPDATVRLFRRGRGRFAERAVHEAVVVEGAVGRLHASLEHFTYDSIGAYLTRMDRYSTLAAMELHHGGRTACVTDLLVRPAWTGLRMLCLQGGWRDGWRGLILAGLYASYVFSKYAKLWELAQGAKGMAQSGKDTGASREP
jgi:glycosyltransferase involved in cell wall biosynthesis